MSEQVMMGRSRTLSAIPLRPAWQGSGACAWPLPKSQKTSKSLSKWPWTPLQVCARVIYLSLNCLSAEEIAPPDWCFCHKDPAQSHSGCATQFQLNVPCTLPRAHRSRAFRRQKACRFLKGRTHRMRTTTRSGSILVNCTVLYLV
jgi:hypothetical protein